WSPPTLSKEGPRSAAGTGCCPAPPSCEPPSKALVSPCDSRPSPRSPGLRAATFPQPRAAGSSRECARRETQTFNDASGTAPRPSSVSSSADAGIRTLTGQDLNLVPLPGWATSARAGQDTNNGRGRVHL